MYTKMTCLAKIFGSGHPNLVMMHFLARGVEGLLSLLDNMCDCTETLPHTHGREISNATITTQGKYEGMKPVCYYRALLGSLRTCEVAESGIKIV